jgi:hypothetical protein
MLGWVDETRMKQATQRIEIVITAKCEGGTVLLVKRGADKQLGHQTQLFSKGGGYLADLI